jgi:hypothetical protein
MTNPARELFAWPQPTRKPAPGASPTRGLVRFYPLAQRRRCAPLAARGPDLYYVGGRPLTPADGEGNVHIWGSATSDD